MKKTLLIVITALAALLTLTATAERKIWMYSHSGNHISMDVTDLDSIGFEEPGSIILNPEKKLLDCSGGRFPLSIQANKPWTATVGDPTLLTISKSDGTGNDNISVLAQSNADEKSYTSFVKFTLSDGTCGYLYVTVDGIVKSVSLDKSNMNIMVGGSESLIATTDPAGSQVTWSSSNNDVATVSNGVVTAVSEGYAVITAKSGSKSADCTVEVSATHIVEPTEGMATIVFSVPEVACDYTTMNFIGDVQGYDPATENLPVAEFVKEGWYKLVLPLTEDGSTQGKICPQSFTGVSCWDYHGIYALPDDAPAWISIYDDFDGPYSKLVLSEGCAGQIAYVNVTKWAADFCTMPNPAGEATFKVSFDIPDDVDPNYIAIYVEGMGAGMEWSALGELQYDKDYKQFRGQVAVPAGCFYKYLISYMGGEKIYMRGDNLRMPYNLSADNFVAEWDKYPFVVIIDEKCKASDYPQVTIGTQVWMAENYRCSKYDTESEAYKEGRYTVPTSDIEVYTPYYTDASDKSKWDSETSAKYGVNLTNEQVAKLGYLYNWAAAVGVADGQKQATEFSGTRQGICPNGWHIPSNAEWQTLEDYIEKIDGKGTDTAGNHLRTTSGWYSGGNGTDTYGFAALPAGGAGGRSVDGVGDYTDFWTATPIENYSNIAYSRYLFYDYDYLSVNNYNKYLGLSVRCLKN